MPSQLAEGEIGFATDTGEVFIGAPNLASTNYITPNPLNRNDSNIRLLTELDSVAQVNKFQTVALPVSANPVTVYTFSNNYNFAIFDYGLTDNSAGPVVSSTLWVVLGTNTNVLNDTAFASNDITFSIASINSNLVLQAKNNISDPLTLNYQVRSWKSITSTTAISRANLNQISGSITIG